jgi:hypothetical protein
MERVPDAETPPIPGSIRREFVLRDDHSRVVDSPCSMDAGEALRVTAGAGGGGGGAAASGGGGGGAAAGLPQEIENKPTNTRNTTYVERELLRPLSPLWAAPPTRKSDLPILDGFPGLIGTSLLVISFEEIDTHSPM